MKLKWRSTITRTVWAAPSDHAYGTYRTLRDPAYSVYAVIYYYTNGDGDLEEREIGSQYTLREAKALAESHHMSHVA